MLHSELYAILIVHTNGRNPSLVSFQHFVMERTDSKKFLYTSGLLQHLDTQLISRHYMWLKTMLIIRRLPFLIQLTQIVLVKFYFHFILSDTCGKDNRYYIQSTQKVELFQKTYPNMHKCASARRIFSEPSQQTL